jgi:1-acyl-sn-glycerol-3-phosphate acyltransferase
MTPFLLILTAKESYYSTFWKLVRGWSYLLVYGMGFHIKKQIDQELDRNQSYMFCPNHTSFMDPFVLIAISKNPIVFVGKKELVKIPIFGFFYKRVVIMVDRSSSTSRRKVFEMAKKRLKGGTSIGIFPEGLVPDEDEVLAPFKKGAFSLAIEHQIPIVPQTYYDCKRLFSWNFFSGGMGTLRVRQHPFIETKDLNKEDLVDVRDKAFQIIYNELSTDELYMNHTNTSKWKNS